MSSVLLVLHVSLLALTSAAGLVFAIAEGGPIPALTLPIGIATFWLVDRQRALALSPFAINAIGLAAFVLAGLEFFSENIEGRLLSGGHLLVYLTWAFLLQEKRPRQVWWLCGLSVLQVAVASLLTYDAWFGLMTPAFLLLAMWTLSVFQVACSPGGELDERATAESPPGANSPSARPPARPGLRTRSVATGSTQLDAGHRWISRRFVVSTVVGTALATLIAVCFFLFIPRVWLRNSPLLFTSGRPIGGAPARSGFTETISLGQIGAIQESARVALEAEVFDRQTGVKLTPEDWLQISGGPVRFRGVVQELYDDGTWTRLHRGEDDSSRSQFEEVSPEAPSRYTLKVRMHLAGSGERDVLFCLGAPQRLQSIQPRRKVYLERDGRTLEAGSNGAVGRTLDYRLEISPEVVTVPRSRHHPLAWFDRSEGRGPRGDVNGYFTVTTSLPREIEADLQAWKQAHSPYPAGAPPASKYELARAWERYLSLSPDFGYTLQLTRHDPLLDPIMDFLEHVHRGHCEYFASALALLLRVEGIPARLVSGYQGGSYDPASGAWSVRDLHAHAWVEAYVEDAPPDPLTGVSQPQWLVLDATPPARDAVIEAQQQSVNNFWFRLQDGVRATWSIAIRMNQGEQRSLIYDPLRSAVADVWTSFRSSVQGGLMLQFRRLLRSPREWFSWQGGVATFVLLTLLSGLAYGIRRSWRGLQTGDDDDGQTSAAAAIIPFYRRLERLLEQAGFVRTAAETPREFVATVEPILSQSATSVEAAQVPASIVSRFYAVRYGDDRLAESEAERIEEQLGRLEQELARSR